MMYKFLLYCLILAPIFLRGFEWQGNPVSYKGLTIFCSQGCGDESDGLEIEQVFESATNKLFKNLHPLLIDKYQNERWIEPWISDTGTYRLFDWPATDGKWSDENRKTYELDGYDSFLELSSLLKRDLFFYHLTAPKLLKTHLEELLPRLIEGYKEGWRCVAIVDGELDFGNKLFGDCNDLDLKSEIASTKKRIKEIQEEIDRQEKYEEALMIADEALLEIEGLYKRFFVYCLQKHQKEGVKFQTALESFIMSDFEEAFEQISSLINDFEKKKFGKDLIAKLYLLKGEIQSEFGLYADAIIALTESIQRNPDLKESYFSRAAAYFELGKFDQAIEDYITSGERSRISATGIPWIPSAELSAGIIGGILEGGLESLADFIPESLNTLRGLSKGLWALAAHPVDSSQAFVFLAAQCVSFMKENSPFDILQSAVPEIKRLVENYDQMSDFEKGNLIGQAIGKYGIDILLCKYSAKTVKAYLELKKANQAMSLEALASPATRQKILSEAGKQWAHREAVLKNSQLQIQWDKQGKHIVGHRNYDPLESKSIWECSKEKTEKLIKEFAGTGTKAHGSGRHIPGEAGYREVVDFGEFIGHVVIQGSEMKVPTNWGTIHYAKNGVHIVPHLRKGKL